jgi:hypothetical protein
VSVEDVRVIITKLVTMARGGDLQAAKLLLDRVLGKPLQGVVVTQLADAEEKQATQLALKRLTPEELTTFLQLTMKVQGDGHDD